VFNVYYEAQAHDSLDFRVCGGQLRLSRPFQTASMKCYVYGFTVKAQHAAIVWPGAEHRSRFAI